MEMDNRQSLIASLAGSVCACRYGATRAETINQLITKKRESGDAVVKLLPGRRRLLPDDNAC